ncbi:MAG: CoA-transferase [Anaerolineae bacterium]
MAKAPDFTTLEGLAAHVQNGDAIGIAGLHFSRLPIALIKAVIASGRKDLDYVTWGGGLPLEMFLAADALRKIVFCFSSLDIFGLSPLFRKALETGAVEYEEWTALAMIQGFHAAEQQLPSMPFQVPAGAEIVQKSGFAPIVPDPISGQLVGEARPLYLDAVLLHVGRVDEAGNVEIQGARGLDKSAIGAARKVLVTAEEIVPRGTFQRDRRGLIIGKTFITAIAHAPLGAYPSSCLPYYAADYRALQADTNVVPVEIRPPAAERVDLMKQAARVPAEDVTGPALLKHRQRVDLDAPPTEDEQMVVSLSRHYDTESVCAAGAVSPLAIVSYMLAKRLHAPNLITMMISSGLVDPNVRPMLLLLAEPMDFQSSVFHCGGDDTYHWYYQRGLVSHEVVSAAQIDRFGRANNILITSPSGKKVRLPGQGGMADVANMHQNFLLYITRHSPLTLVHEVEYVSAGRGLVTDEERIAAGYRPGYTRLVTNLGIFEKNKTTGLLELVATHPGVRIDDVRAQTGFEILVAPHFKPEAPPTADELRALRTEIDPLGIRRLEFIPSKERAALIDELLTAEEAAIRELAP